MQIARKCIYNKHTIIIQSEIRET